MKISLEGILVFLQNLSPNCHLILNEGVSQHNFLIRHLHRLEKRLQSVALRVRRQNVDHLSRLRRPALGRFGLTFQLDKNLEDSFRSCWIKDFQVRQDVVQVWNKNSRSKLSFKLSLINLKEETLARALRQLNLNSASVNLNNLLTETISCQFAVSYCNSNTNKVE